MNKTRFYEITQAAAKGEDLSVFVPTNAAEAELIANLGGGGATIELPAGGTPFTDNNVPLSTLYFKTDMSIEEVNNIIDQANAVNTYTQMGEGAAPVFSSNSGATLVLVVMEGEHFILFGNGSSFTYIYQSIDNGLGFVGWHPAIFTDKNYFTIKEFGETFGTFEMDSIESFSFINDSIASVIAPLVSANKPYSDGKKKVSGTYDGSEITVTVTGDQTIDVESLLDQNKLPLKIKVRVSE